MSSDLIAQSLSNILIWKMSNNSVEDQIREGNSFFGKRQYHQAIDIYSKLIQKLTKLPNSPTEQLIRVYNNRALCFLNQVRFDSVY